MADEGSVAVSDSAQTVFEQRHNKNDSDHVQSVAWPEGREQEIYDGLSSSQSESITEELLEIRDSANHVCDESDEIRADAEGEEHFDFVLFLQSLDTISGPVDEALDSVIDKVSDDINHLITLADLYTRPSGRLDAVRRVLQHRLAPEIPILDRLHSIAARKSCLDSMLAVAEANHVLSQHSVALMFSEYQRPAEFESWLNRAADSGHVLSMMGMVSILSHRDPKSSFIYARRAADCGLRAAQFIVGRCLIMGHGVDIDFPAGLSYILKAADAGLPDAQVLAGGIFIHGHDNVASDKERAMKFFTLAAQQGNAEAMYILGSLMLSGSPQSQADRQNAIRLITCAADAGNARAQLDLGKMYNAGEVVTEDVKQGFVWCLRAASNGMPSAAFIVAIMYLEGMGCEKNVVAGCHWFERAAAADHNDAGRSLSVLLADQHILEGFEDWKMSQSLLKIMAPSLRVNLAAL